MIFYGAIVAVGFAAGYFYAAGVGSQTVTAIGNAVKNAELDAIGLLDDSADTNNSVAGNP